MMKEKFIPILERNLKYLRNDISENEEILFTDFIYNVIYDIEELWEDLETNREFLINIWKLRVVIDNNMLSKFFFGLPKEEIDRPHYEIDKYILNGYEKFEIKDDILYII